MWKMFRPGPSDRTPLLSDIDSTAPASPAGPSTAAPLSPASDPDDSFFSSPMDSLHRGSNTASPPAWSDPLGRPARGDDDEHLLMFRRAVGINSDNLWRSPQPTAGGGGGGGGGGSVGIYASVLRQERRKRALHHALCGLVWGGHAVQIVLGAALTCLGLSAGEHPVTVTVLGAVNTVAASFLALVKGKGLTEKLGRTEADFRQLKAWLEETEALLALGVIGGDRKEVGLLIETAFRRYNACFGRSFDIEAGMDREGVDDYDGREEGREGRGGS